MSNALSENESKGSSAFKKHKTVFLLDQGLGINSTHLKQLRQVLDKL